MTNPLGCRAPSVAPLRSALAAVALAAMALPSSASAEMTADEARDIEEIVENYILDNPDIIERALLKLQEQRQAQEKAKQAEAIVSLRDTIYDSEHQAVVGNPEGTVTIVEFFDYNCSYCRRAVGDMLALMESNPDLRVVLKEFPILSEESTEAARIGVAIKDTAPERYLEFHHEMFTRGGVANEAKALAIADELGLDTRALKKAAAQPSVDENIEEVRSLALALGVNGTPSYVIGDETVAGAVGFDQLQERIVEARKCETVVC